MLTRPTSTITVTAANKFLPGSGNPYSHDANPYSPKSDTSPTNEAPKQPKAPREPKTEERQMETETPEAKVKTGYLHAIAGLTPQADDTMYAFGYDEGIAVLANHFAGMAPELDWQPQGTHGVISARLDNGDLAYVAAAGEQWTAWVEDPAGAHVASLGETFSVEAAAGMAEEYALRSTFTMGKLLDDVYATNPGIDPRQAVRVARKATAIAVEAMRQ